MISLFNQCSLYMCIGKFVNTPWYFLKFTVTREIFKITKAPFNFPHIQFTHWSMFEGIWKPLYCYNIFTKYKFVQEQLKLQHSSLNNLQFESRIISRLISHNSLGRVYKSISAVFLKIQATQKHNSDNTPMQ